MGTKQFRRYTLTSKGKNPLKKVKLFKPSLGLTLEDVYGLSLKDVKKFNKR